MNTTRHPRSRRFATALKLTPIALASLVASQSGVAATRTWDGGAGGANPYWDLVGNWDTAVPVAGDIANLGNFATTVRSGTFALLSMSGTGALTMTGGTLSVTAASTAGALTFSGGSLGGSATLTAASIAWNGGTIGTSGATGGTLRVNGVSTWNSNTKYVHYGQSYEVRGNTTWQDYGTVYLYGAGVGFGESTITVFAGKKLTLAGDDSTNYFFLQGPGRFVNNGSVDKNGSNIFYVDTLFENNGTLNINAGEVRFRETRTIGGTINTAAGALLRFQGNTVINPAITIAGDGDIDFNGTSAVLASGTVTLGGAGTKSFTAGTLGGAGTLVLNNLTWTNGTMGNSTSTGGVTTVNGETTLGTNTKYVHYGRTLNLNGPVTWDPNGQLYIYGAGAGYGASTVNLTAGNVMTMAGNSSSYDQIYGPGVFNNAGTINKNGTGILYIDSEFNNNTGTVNTNAGETRFRNTRTLGGALTVAEGAILRFDGNTTFGTGFAVTGDGETIFDGSSNLLTSGTKTIGGAGTKTMVGGTLGGAGTLKLSNLTWLGGTMGAASSVGGTTTVTGEATLGTSTKYVHYGRTVNFQGDVTWDPNGQLYIYGAGAGYGTSVVNLAAGKTLMMAGNASSYDQIFGPGTFNNAGTITKNGTGLFYVDSTFSNTGTVNINKGTLILRNTQTLGGTVNVGSMGTLYLNGATTLAPALSLAGAGKLLLEGTVLQTSGTRTFGGGGKKTLNGTLGGAATMVFDNLTWLNGTMGSSTSVGGTTTVNGPATLSTATHYLNYGRTLNLNGDTTWDANGALYLYGAGAGYGQSVANLAAGKTLALANNASSYDQIYGPGTFNNAGTIAKTGTGTFYIDSILNNSGTLSATKGLTQLRATGGGVNNTGTLFANGGRIEVTQTTGLAQWNATSRTLTGGTFRVTGNQPIALNLGNTVKTNQAKIYLNGAGAQILETSTNPDRNALTGLTANKGSAVLSLLNGAMLTTAGSLTNSGSGTVIVGSGATNLTIAGGGKYKQSSATASTFIGGTLTVKNFDFTSGTLSAGNAAGLIGNGTIAAAATGALTFGALSNLALEVSGANWDKLAVPTGNVIVDGTVAATFSGGANVGTYRFLTTTAGVIGGTFDSFTSNLNPAQYSVTAAYGTKYVDLVVALVPPPAPAPGGIDGTLAGIGAVNAVPEPETYALMLAGLALLGWRVRRHRAA
ncbi:MAG: PEP-CTERM sorting domain-containing protein [Burkholderiales bacterium]|nr:PEP-CTERM sorting domain-containing protein [Burkholderiales bacterium]